MIFKYLNTAPLMGIFIGMLFMETTGCKKSITTSQPEEEVVVQTDAKFTLLQPQETGVGFVNQMREDFEYNNFNFEYMYNGGGVAAGDVNGDGLPDLYFSSSLFSNKLYLNQGNFKFIDVTAAAGVEAATGFKTGVAMADINGDGRLDIYSCRTSKKDNGLKNDFLFINMGNRQENGVNIPVFEDQGKKLGVEDNSNTNHACFFDYDRDGDMDLFLLNHKLGFEAANRVRIQEHTDGNRTRITEPETPFESNKFYENVNGVFKDITKKTGLVSSTFGLSATTADINMDGWMDLYVANDYVEPDFIYINNHDGTFTDYYSRMLKHSSQSSMGSDIADFNNDGLVDIVVTDMKTEDPIRYKKLLHSMVYDRYNLLVEYGYGRQVGRNVLQLNNGNGTFSEIGQYAGIATTDWSWGSIMADFDNDGWKDVYITNGYRKDVSDLDYFNFFRDSIEKTGGLTSQRFPDLQQFMENLPEQKIANYLFINDHNLSFTNATKGAGMDQLSFSNGTAYADLDLDGDLDLIVNNIDEPAFIYRNEAAGKNWLQIDVQEDKGNTQGIGSTVDVYAGGTHQYAMLITSKGFFSTSEPILHFGFGSTAMIDTIIFTWPDGGKEIMTGVKTNQRIIWKRGSGEKYTMKPKQGPTPLFTKSNLLKGWIHQENDFVDLKRERLLPYMMSAEGPCLAIGDINGDKLEDLYAGNGNGFGGALFVQKPDNSFVSMPSPIFVNDAVYEDCGGQFDDFDGDGDQDLIVISGGNAFNQNALEYMTRYYLNDGKGSFSRAANFPIIRTNAGAILAVDIDQDNDMDVIIGGRSTPGSFPVAPKSYLLKNEKGKFTDVTKEFFPALENIGMITDLDAADLDGDGRKEVIIAGEWMPISIFSFNGKMMADKTPDYGLEKTAGWWKSITIDDIDGDGDQDIVAGNIGLNNRLHASEKYPVTVIAKDFDGNGSLDPLMCYYYQGKLYPYVGKDAIIGQIPKLKKKYVRYTPYASATIQDIFNSSELDGSLQLYAYTFQSTLFINDQKKFVVKPIPYQAQFSPVYDVVIRDFDGDGKKDILMAGNFTYSETETGEMDAGNGTLLLQQADGSFAYRLNRDHGFWAQGEVRELKLIHLADGKEAILTGNNRGPIEVNMIVK
ncbi:MAG: CRTAC1 family protein [Saprospiraceae bacterium]|nr:CRTAC1 family protein [Saprospiraceae bacterium]